MSRRAPAGRWAAAATVGLGGCLPGGGDGSSLVVATTWPAAARVACDAAYREAGGRRAIAWVVLGGRRWLDACDRRGGLDLILGGPPRNYQRLADLGRLEPIDPADPVPWRAAEYPPGRPRAEATGADPRDDAAAFAAADAVLDRRGWAAGYESLVRRPGAWPPRADGTGPPARGRDAVALVRGGMHPDQARRFLAALAARGWVAPPAPDAATAARVDDLLADLLGAALVDARNERRDALAALAAHDHPAVAEAAVGEVPPWPPASVAGLRADPGRRALADALAGQVAPDDEMREWLEYSWRQPRRPVDPALLRALAQAEGGRLAREPRFRAWLRGEWAAWTRQLYRRVARLAGGYRPA